jgi:hypothetical protein
MDLMTMIIMNIWQAYTECDKLVMLVVESPTSGTPRRGKAEVFCVLMTITAPPASAQQRTPAGGWYDQYIFEAC